MAQSSWWRVCLIYLLLFLPHELPLSVCLPALLVLPVSLPKCEIIPIRKVESVIWIWIKIEKKNKLYIVEMISSIFFFSNTFWLLDFTALWIYWKCLDHTRTTLESSSWNSLMLIMSVQSRLYSKVTAMNKALALWIIGCGSKSDSCGIPYNVTPCWGSTCCCLVVNALNDLHRYSF